KVVGQVRLFLEGRNEELKQSVQKLMDAAAEREDFEAAARHRDLLRDIDKTLEKQKVVSHREFSRDVLGFHREGETILFYLMMIRGGSLQENRSFFFKSHEEDGEVLASWLLQFYEEGRLIPPEILLPFAIAEATSVSEILTERAGRKVELQFPQ